MFKKISIFSALIVFVLILQACVPGADIPPEDVLVPVTGGIEQSSNADEMLDEVVEGLMDIDENVNAPEQLEMNEADSADEVVRPAPMHEMIPANPILLDVQNNKDCVSGYTRSEDSPVIPSTGCDVWQNNYLERPFDEEGFSYNPNLDIVQQALGYDPDWFFVRIRVLEDEGVEPLLDNSYGVELDLDVDGDGDVLIYVVNPAALPRGEWGVQGVYVYQDKDDDVGGAIPDKADGEPYMGNGYETLYFENGYGDDADAAWARVSPQYANAIEFAFKRYLIEEENSFMWWVWSSKDAFAADKFDYVDSFAENEKYSVDNTCRWAVFAPQNVNHPNTCPVYVPPPTPVPGQDPPPPPPPRDNQPGIVG